MRLITYHIKRLLMGRRRSGFRVELFRFLTRLKTSQADRAREEESGPSGGGGSCRSGLLQAMNATMHDREIGELEKRLATQVG